MDEEGHLKIDDFGLAVENMWLGEKIQEDWATGTPLFHAPEVSLMSSLTNDKLFGIIASDLGYRMIADKSELSCILFSVRRVTQCASTLTKVRPHEHTRRRAQKHVQTSSRAHKHSSTPAHEKHDCTRRRVLRGMIFTRVYVLVP